MPAATVPDFPFLFLRHGVTSTPAQRLWVVLADPAAAAEALRVPLTALAPRVSVRCGGPLLLFNAKAVSSEALEATLREAHRQTPLALVVRTTRAAGSAWHRHTQAQPAAVLDVFARLVRAHRGPYRRARRPAPPLGLDLAAALLAELEHEAPLAVSLRDAVEVLRASTRGRGRAVLDDLLLERLPQLLERTFDVDLVLRHLLATVEGVGEESVPMSKAFLEARVARVGELLATVPGRTTAVEWSSVEAVREALSREAWVELAQGLTGTEPSHIAVLEALTGAERATLARRSRALAMHLANAGAMLLSGGEVLRSLELYDAALEGTLDPRACANPLVAVQDDTHHQGVDVARARRYLARCLPYGEDNAVIFLNAAFVFMELGEPSRALEMLARAKAGGVPVGKYRNERLFAPLRGEPGFLALLG